MLKKKTKLIILGSSVVILTSTIFSTIIYRENVNKVQKQKVIENNILLKKVSDKKILNKKIADAKVLAKKVADKKIADEKIRIAKLNEGITLKEAIAICDKIKREGSEDDVVYSTTELTFNSNKVQLIKGSLFYEFDINNPQDVMGDALALCSLCISKKTGKAYQYFINTKRLIPYAHYNPSERTVINQTTTKPVEQVKINDGVGVYDKAYAPKDLVVKGTPGESYTTVGTI